MSEVYYGYHGKLLRIDLTHQSSGVEAISTDDLHLFWGGRGLGALFLFRELPRRPTPCLLRTL